MPVNPRAPEIKKTAPEVYANNKPGAPIDPTKQGAQAGVGSDDWEDDFNMDDSSDDSYKTDADDVNEDLEEASENPGSDQYRASGKPGMTQYSADKNQKASGVDAKSSEIPSKSSKQKGGSSCGC